MTSSILTFPIVWPPFKNKKRRYNKTDPSENAVVRSMYLREKYVQYPIPHYSSTNECSCQCLWGNFCRGPMKTAAMCYWASRAFVYTNAQNLRFPAMPETVGSACWGSTPNPLNSVSRWLRRYEPDGFLKNAITFYGVVCDYAGKPASPFSKNLRQGREKKRRNGA